MLIALTTHIYVIFFLPNKEMVNLICIFGKRRKMTRILINFPQSQEGYFNFN